MVLSQGKRIGPKEHVSGFPDTFRYLLPERRLWFRRTFTSTAGTPPLVKRTFYRHGSFIKGSRYPALHRIRVFKGTKVVIRLIKVVIRQRSVGVMAERVGGTGGWGRGYSLANMLSSRYRLCPSGELAVRAAANCLCLPSVPRLTAGSPS